MSAVAYPEKTFTDSRKADAAKPAKGFFARLLDAVVAARTEEAARILARYGHRPDRDPAA